MLIFILDIFECSGDTCPLVKAKANGPNYKHRVRALACIIIIIVSLVVGTTGVGWGRHCFNCVELQCSVGAKVSIVAVSFRFIKLPLLGPHFVDYAEI